jgi:hypothetical protein
LLTSSYMAEEAMCGLVYHIYLHNAHHFNDLNCL